MDLDVKNLPKIELHCHLDCAARPGTVFEVAKTIGADLPTKNFEAFKKAVLITEPMTDLKTVLSKFLVARDVLQSTEILERVAFEATEDAFLQGTKLIEFRYSPSFIRSGKNTLPFDAIHSALTNGITRAQEQFEIEVGLIGILGRNDSLALAEEVLEFVLSKKDDFVGIDLADNEQDFDCTPFAPLFQKARGEGLNVTVHAGEAIYPGNIKAVIDSIEQLGAQRIGHGIQIIHDESVMNLVKNKDVHLEVCPTSNYLTNSVESLQSHPVRALFDRGISLSLNTDDPGIFDLTLVGEYTLLQKHHNFSRADLIKCNQMAYEASFLPNKEIIKHHFFN